MASTFDSHCHLDAPEYEGDRDAVVRRALDAGVRRILVPAADPADWPRVLAVASRYPDVVRAGLGIHPWALPALGPAALDALLTELPGRVADAGVTVVGECGLDGFIAKRGVPFPVQEQVVRRHVELSLALGRPVVLHCLRAHGRMLELLRPFGTLRGVLHSYSGPAELVPAFAALGLGFSFAGAVSWPGARRPLLAAAAVPDDRILVESDGPDQGRFVDGDRRSRSEPEDVVALSELLGRLRGRPLPDNAALLDCGAD